MDYTELIEERKSTRKFQEKEVSASQIEEIKAYYSSDAKCLVSGIETELLVFGTDAREKLEGAAGYEDFMIGAPQYLVLLTQKADFALENAGYIMEDLVLKLTDMDLGSCWITFTDSEKVKGALGIESDKDTAAIVAFGHKARAKKRIRLNILSMSNVDVEAKLHFNDPKKKISDMVYLNEYGNQEGLEEHIGFYEDILWESLNAAALSPSYLNRQPYALVIKDGKIILVAEPDKYTDAIDEALGLGIVMLHFAGAASEFSINSAWDCDAKADIDLPEGCRVAGVISL